MTGNVWKPRRKGEQTRTVTGYDPHYDMVHYVKANGWPHFASPDQFRKWAKRVGARL